MIKHFWSKILFFRTHHRKNAITELTLNWGVLKINCHTYNSPPEYWKNQYALNQQNKKIPFKIRPYSNFIAGYYIFYGSVRLQMEFIGKKLFQWIHLGLSQVFITFRELLLIYLWINLVCIWLLGCLLSNKLNFKKALITIIHTFSELNLMSLCGKLVMTTL